MDSAVWNVFPGVAVPLPPPLSTHGFMILLSATVLIGLALLGRRRKDPVPTGLANLLELFVAFIRDHICVEHLGPEDGRRMTPLFCSFFSFILVMNLVGLVPGFAPATSDVRVTAALALITFCFMTFGAICRIGPGGYFKALVPPGIPWPAGILIFVAEFLGIFVRVFALCIRLFVNELAGHIVLFSLIGLVAVFGFRAFPAIGMALFVYVLEILIAVLQAYIFTLLSAIFIGQRYHPSHG
jgi:F-type H+-transporting ATPase subunit a